MTGAPSRGRGRPRALTLADVVEGAAGVDPADLTMAAVADRLGVAVATLYNYVDGAQELRRLLAHRLLRSAGVPEIEGHDWRSWLEAYLLRVRDAIRTQPELADHVELGAHALLSAMAVDRAMQVLTAAGITRVEALLLLDFGVQLAVRGGSAAYARAFDAEEQRCQLRAIRKSVQEADGVNLPELAAFADEIGDPEDVEIADPDTIFGFELALLLDGIATQLHRRGGPA